MSTVIETRGLRKTFGPTVALDGLDLTVEQGEVHGFLGPNGAGKSTTLRVLLGLLRADGGSVRVLGADPWGDAAELHRRIAYVPGDVAPGPTSAGARSSTSSTGSVAGSTSGAAPASWSASTSTRRRSAGPTPRATGRRSRWSPPWPAPRPCSCSTSRPRAWTPSWTRSSATPSASCGPRASVLLSSHILSEVENLSDHVTIIRAGRAVQTGALSEMRHLSHTMIDAQVATPDGIAGELAASLGVEDLLVEGGRVRCSVDPSGLPGAMAILGRHGLQSLVSRPPRSRTSS